MATQYATEAELAQFSLPGNVLADIPGGVQTAALVNASAIADGYLAARYHLPLSAWGADLKQAVTDIAAWLCLKRLGFNPADADSEISTGNARAVKWLEGVARGDITPAITDTAPVTSGAGAVLSAPRRGW